MFTKCVNAMSFKLVITHLQLDFVLSTTHEILKIVKYDAFGLWFIANVNEKLKN